MAPTLPYHLDDTQLLKICVRYRIRATIPYSLLEAETVHRNIDLRTIARLHLKPRN